MIFDVDLFESNKKEKIKLKFETKREKSLEYWKNRNNKTIYYSFLFVLKTNTVLPKLPKDIKKLIYDYVMKFTPFHCQPTYLTKSFELVNSINIVIPKTSMVCTFISFGKHKEGGAIFKLLNNDITKKIREVNNSVIDSLLFCRDKCKTIRNTRKNECINNYQVIIEENDGDWFLYYGSIPYDHTHIKTVNIFHLRCVSNGLFDHAFPVKINEIISRPILMKIKGVSICKNKGMERTKLSYKLSWLD